MEDRYILMLEGDTHDRELTREFFEKGDIRVAVEFLSYSNEVIPYLRAAGKLPSLVLLRLNAVPESGLEVLKRIKQSELFRHIPVIILGESTLPDLTAACYAAGACTVINKPLSVEMTDRKINSFLEYWFRVAELPEAKVAGHLN